MFKQNSREVIPKYLGATMNVKKLREQLGISQETFARMLQASASSVKRWEQGYEPSAAYRQLIEQLVEELKEA